MAKKTSQRMGPVLASAWLLGAVCVAVAGSDTVPDTKPKAEASAKPTLAEASADRLAFPGLTIDLKRRLVDLEATVCLDRGPLELIACAKGTKEHESILSLKAKPRQVHLGLLLIGAKNGKPAMRRRVESEGVSPRWIDIPPSGDPIAVSLVLQDKTGKPVEHPISDFVTRTSDQADGAEAAVTEEPNPEVAQGERDKPNLRFPDTFLFVGSHTIQDKQGQRQYLADVQGNVISISTFGDEVLSLPGSHSKDNGALLWQVNPKKLPKVGTVVTLRLRPKAARGKQADTE